MPYEINSDCISCGACESACPVSCISQGENQFEINEEACIDCGSCADTCPMGAIAQKED